MDKISPKRATPVNFFSFSCLKVIKIIAEIVAIGLLVNLSACTFFGFIAEEKRRNVMRINKWIKGRKKKAWCLLKSCGALFFWFRSVAGQILVECLKKTEHFEWHPATLGLTYWYCVCVCVSVWFTPHQSCLCIPAPRSSTNFTQHPASLRYRHTHTLPCTQSCWLHTPISLSRSHAHSLNKLCFGPLMR